MGQLFSQNPLERVTVTYHTPPPTPPPRHIEYIMDIEPFPDDILLLILSYVPAEDLMNSCRLVNQRWKELVDSPTVWRLKCENEGVANIRQVAEMCYDVPWQTVSWGRPFSRNLLRNPCGTEGRKYWRLQDGGDGWVIESNHSPLEGAESQTCFVTSYFWCIKRQYIDLLQEGLWEHFLDVHQPVICISDWYAGRRDCACIYEIEVQLLAADKKTVIQEFSKRPDPIPRWNDAKYRQITHEFRNYGPGVRYVVFMHKGKDIQFWKGWYGVRVTNSSVTLKCDSLEPCCPSLESHSLDCLAAHTSNCCEAAH
ncbi:F-box only protein 27 isoform X2 [Hyperolius riggenbachi]|uniref:F-box only protein 27 isoform X2 n=1 Tax=Hyperolius riggenbachi TaxID=752182 RepID=UPI0035A3297D